jgi:hypothetical protein
MPPRTLIYVYKVPKKHLLKLLCAMDTDLTEAKLKDIDRVCGKTTIHRLFYYALLIGPGDRIWAHAHAAFDHAAVQRHAKLGSMLAKLKLADRCAAKTLDWAKDGYFELQPKFKQEEDAEPDKHTFTTVLDKYTGKSCPLPPFILVTAEWSLECNWSYREATLATPKHAKPSWKSKIVDFFETHFKDYQNVFIPAPPEAAKVDDKDDEDEREDSDADDSAAAEPKETPKKKAKVTKAGADEGSSPAVIHRVANMHVRQTLSQKEFSQKLARLHKIAKSSATGS